MSFETEHDNASCFSSSSSSFPTLAGETPSSETSAFFNVTSHQIVMYMDIVHTEMWSRFHCCLGVGGLFHRVCLPYLKQLVEKYDNEDEILEEQEMENEDGKDVQSMELEKETKKKVGKEFDASGGVDIALSTTSPQQDQQLNEAEGLEKQNQERKKERQREEERRREEERKEEQEKRWAERNEQRDFTSRQYYRMLRCYTGYTLAVDLDLGELHEASPGREPSRLPISTHTHTHFHRSEQLAFGFSMAAPALESALQTDIHSRVMRIHILVIQSSNINYESVIVTVVTVVAVVAVVVVRRKKKKKKKKKKKMKKKKKKKNRHGRRGLLIVLVDTNSIDMIVFLFYFLFLFLFLFLFQFFSITLSLFS